MLAQPLQPVQQVLIRSPQQLVGLLRLNVNRTRVDAPVDVAREGARKIVQEGKETEHWNWLRSEIMQRVISRQLVGSRG